MAIKDLWNRLFGRKNNSDTASGFSDATTDKEENCIVLEKPFDYGLDMIGLAIYTGDYGWDDKPFKKVTLVNPKDCENKINLIGMMSRWRGTGHGEWEALLAWWFVDAVVNALKSESDEADISALFDRDLLARNNRVFTQEQIYAHIIPSFEIVKDNDDGLWLKLKFG